MPEEEQNSNNSPTWADFKPPVVTTPYGETSGSASSPIGQAYSDRPPSLPAETIPEATSPEDWVTASLAANPSEQEPAQAKEVVPTPLPAVAIALPEEHESVKVPANTSEPDPPPQPVEFSQPSSRHDDNFFPPILPTASEPAPAEPTIIPESPPETTPTSLPRVAVPGPVSAVPTTSLASTSAEQVISDPPKSSVRKVVVLAVGGLVLLATAAGGYFYLNNAPSSLPNTSSQSSENTAILADSEAASSWENNYSTSLLASERGGLEFLATDPPTIGQISEKLQKIIGSAEAATESASTPAEKIELTSLKVKIAKVDVHLATQSIIASGVSPEATKSANKSIDRWETLRLNANTTVDLMDLRNKGGALSSLGITYLAAGRYTEIRLFITSAEAVTKDGIKLSVEIPGKSGLVKLIKPFDVSSTGTLKLIVDFDAPGMVIKTGDTYQLRPVVAKVIYNDQEI